MSDQRRTRKPHYYSNDPEGSVLVCGLCGALIWEVTQPEHEFFHRATATETDPPDAITISTAEVRAAVVEMARMGWTPDFEGAQRIVVAAKRAAAQPTGCGNCNGSGWEVYPLDGGEGYPCPECEGTGQPTEDAS